MVFKVNYGLERAERNRLKQAKKEAKAAAKKAAGGEREAEPETPEEPDILPVIPPRD
jgi:septal ring factor EnvC (AmiA/AmiB activator)